MAESFIERNSWAPGVIVAVVLFVIGTATTLYLRHRDKERKTLDYRTLSNVAVLTNTSSRPERLKILFDSNEARDPFITQIRIQNTGKQVIEPEDFLTCIQISRESCKILEWGLVEESADGVSGYMGMTEFSGEDARIDITPGTMNSRDSFTMQIVFDGDKDAPLRVTSRMRGENRPMQVIAPDRRAMRIHLGYVALSSAILLAFAFTFGKKWESIQLILVTAVVALIINFLVSLTNSRDD